MATLRDRNLYQNLESYPNAATITPSDTVDLANPTRAIFIGGAGDLKVNTLAGSTVVLGSIPAGTLLPLAVTRIFSTGTTATGIIALW